MNIYDSTGTLTAGVSFDNAAGLSGAISQLSVVGVNEAFNSVTGGKIGPPWVVPEPSTLSLGVLGLASLLSRQRLVARR